ncbi:Flavin reductase domain FMN-binding protein [Crenothrix polyspora]|uniref:Flavin reductase domain FMN-binding protein n=1 Tax=Crenothrix polyspora TaxID=360316 RepID=A0A1R4GZV7_9GAMM|nr:flavin reductase family protein [Crenothrix polyspora]SJM89482.1 Flavin reductase domain FMN-binding protein [Crenothrix polyspora]
MIENPDAVCKYLSHGVYVIGVTAGEQRNAFTAAWVMQVSFNPLMLAISINPHNYSYTLLKTGGICSVNVLGQHKYQLAEHFGRSGLTNKMTGFQWQTAKTGAPILSESLAYFDCQVSHITDAGDHKIAVCNVLAAGRLQQGVPLLYGQTGNMDGSDKLYQAAK